MVSAFNKLEIRYAVVGGLALAFHGKPRFTRDVDVLVRHDDMDVLKMALYTVGYVETQTRTVPIFRSWKKMTRIEKAVKIASDLYDFYHRIPKVPAPSPVEGEKQSQGIWPNVPDKDAGERSRS